MIDIYWIHVLKYGRPNFVNAGVPPKAAKLAIEAPKFGKTGRWPMSSGWYNLIIDSYVNFAWMVWTCVKLLHAWQALFRAIFFAFLGPLGLDFRGIRLFQKKASCKSCTWRLEPKLARSHWNSKKTRLSSSDLLCLFLALRRSSSYFSCLKSKIDPVRPSHSLIHQFCLLWLVLAESHQWFHLYRGSCSWTREMPSWPGQLNFGDGSRYG